MLNIEFAKCCLQTRLLERNPCNNNLFVSTPKLKHAEHDLAYRMRHTHHIQIAHALSLFTEDESSFETDIIEFFEYSSF